MWGFMAVCVCLCVYITISSAPRESKGGSSGAPELLLSLLSLCGLVTDSLRAGSESFSLASSHVGSGRLTSSCCPGSTPRLAHRCSLLSGTWGHCPASPATALLILGQLACLLWWHWPRSLFWPCLLSPVAYSPDCESP